MKRIFITLLTMAGLLLFVTAVIGAENLVLSDPYNPVKLSKNRQIKTVIYLITINVSQCI